MIVLIEQMLMVGKYTCICDLNLKREKNKSHDFIFNFSAYKQTTKTLDLTSQFK